MSMGETAENVAKKYQITRKRAGGVRRALATARRPPRRQAGSFDDEIVPIDAARTSVVERTAASAPDTTLEALAGLEARLRRRRAP